MMHLGYQGEIKDMGSERGVFLWSTCLIMEKYTQKNWKDQK